MTIQYRGTARPPGPVGMNPAKPQGSLWQKQTVTPTPNTTQAVTKTVMPLPLDDSQSKNAHAVTVPLFSAAKPVPAYGNVKQAPSLVNCPVASILAALAHTASGRNVLTKLISETAALTLTEFPGLSSADLSSPPAGMKITSSRYFTVSLPRGAQVVSDVLYTNDADRSWTALYMHDPKNQSIWAAIIEKALALQLGSYRNFDVGAKTVTANEFWEKIVGVKPDGFAIDSGTDAGKIIKAAQNATRVSSIAASKPDSRSVKKVTAFHGYALLGMQGPKTIKLYDPAEAQTVDLSVAEFQHDFQAILFHK
jgi:hypothetical protein